MIPEMKDFGSVHSQSVTLKDGQLSLKLRQKVAELELALANQTSSSNSEVVALEQELAKLRASFERNELLRRKLEYEITVVRKELNDEIRNKIEQGEAKRKELDLCKEDILKKTTSLEAANSLLRDQEVLFSAHKDNTENEMNNLKEVNLNLQKRIHDLDLEVDEETKRVAVVTTQLNEKLLELEQTSMKMQQQRILFEKERMELSKKLGEQECANAHLKTDNANKEISWKSKVEELVSKQHFLEEEISRKSLELASMEESCSEQKVLFDKERESFLKELNEQRASNSNMHQDNDKTILNWKSKCEELSEKCSILESQRIEHTTTIHKIVHDNKQICSNELEWVEKNKELHVKVKTLLENIEAERATHLETKFSTELLERKLQEMEAALDSERGSLKVHQNTTEEMKKKCQQLNEANSLLVMKNSELANKYEMQSKQIADRSVALSNANLDLLKIKEELAEMHTNLSLLKSNEKNVIKELHLLLDNHEHKFDLTTLPVDWEFHNVVDVVSIILKVFRSHMKDLEEHKRLSTMSIERMSAEVCTNKQEALVSSKALEEADRLVKTAQHHVSVLEVKCANFDKKVESLNGEVRLLNSNLLCRNEKIAELTNMVDQVKLEAEQSYQSMCSTLQMVYDSIFSGSVQQNSSSYSIDELKDLIFDQLKQNRRNQTVCEDELNALRNCAKQSAEELNHFKQVNRKLKKINADLTAQHKKYLDDDESSKGMTEKELERYKNELQQAENDKKLMMSKCSDSERIIKESGDINESLQKSLNLIKKENKSMVACMVIVTGGLWALLRKHQSLCVEKSILVNIIRQLFRLKGDVLQLANTIHLDTSHHEPTDNINEQRLRGVFRFRAVVITVLGALRLQRIGASTKSINSSENSIVCCNNLLFYGIFGKTTDYCQKEQELSSWLDENTSIKNACLDAVVPLFAPENPNDNSMVICQDNLVETVSACYSKYLASVEVEMERSSALSACKDWQESLVNQLGYGLTMLLSERESCCAYKPVDNVTSLLRQSLLDLTMKHHNSEKEKINLLETCEKFEGDNHQLRVQIGTHIAKLEETESMLKAHIWDLERQIDKTVSSEQFVEVCTNLDEALKREDHLQALLKSQKDEIIQITSKIDHQEVSYQQSINLLTSNFKSHQSEFHNLQGKMEELQNKLVQLEKEKEDLSDLLRKEHGALESFMLERKIVVEYVKKVSSVLKKSGCKLDPVYVNKLSKLHEIVPQKVLGQRGKCLSPEMETIQAHIVAIVDLHKGVLGKVINQLKEIQTLQTDAKAHKLNVHKLKNQISALCQEDTLLDNEVVSRAKETSSPVFVPLNVMHT